MQVSRTNIVFIILEMKKPMILVITLLSGIGFLIINWLIGKAKLVGVTVSNFGNPLKSMFIRKDAQGSGAFWASRLGRYHEGVDLLCSKGEAVFSPMAGVILRKAYPYGNDLKYEGCVIFDAKTQTEVKLFYMICSKVGNTVKVGEQIGYCQAISEKYGSTMKNHLHIEIRQEGKLINPEAVYKL